MAPTFWTFYARSVNAAGATFCTYAARCIMLDVSSDPIRILREYDGDDVRRSSDRATAVLGQPHIAAQQKPSNKIECTAITNKKKHTTFELPWPFWIDMDIIFICYWIVSFFPNVIIQNIFCPNGHNPKCKYARKVRI